MAEQKKTYSGVKITQNPGGNSNFSLNWGYQEELPKKNTTNPESITPVKAEQIPSSNNNTESKAN